MNRTSRTFFRAVLALLALALSSNASAQLLAAKEGPIVYGHHHLNVTSLEEHRSSGWTH